MKSMLKMVTVEVELSSSAPHEIDVWMTAGGAVHCITHYFTERELNEFYRELEEEYASASNIDE